MMTDKQFNLWKRFNRDMVKDLKAKGDVERVEIVLDNQRFMEERRDKIFMQEQLANAVDYL